MPMRRGLLAAVLVSALVLAGCTVGTSGAEGEFELLVSDAPAAIGDFDSLDVTFSEARVFRGDEDDGMGEEVNETEDDSEEEAFRTLSLDKTVDLTELVGVRAASLLNTTLPAGNYTKIELYASDINGVVDGNPVQVKIPPGKLMLTKPFTVGPNTTTRFVFDIEVMLRGNAQNNQGYILKPVISESGIANEDVRVRRAGERAHAERPDGDGPPADAGPAGQAQGPQ